ncbi:MAG: (d)CMP kinase [Bacteroidales bacterium]|nr:(d)CMP kinase [Bacteroidales bacterium]
MQVPDIIIAIDGYSSTGKSTLAKLLAKEFSFLYLDSGALYRGVTLFAQEHGYITEDGVIDEEALRSHLGELDLHFEYTPEGSKTFIGDRCVEAEIRSLRVSGQVSPISAIAFVRAFVDDKLHEAGAAKRVVMDGRDIGTTVFPDAELKIFMTASTEVRTRRRYDEMVGKGETPDWEEVKANLLERDYIDSHREVSPLARAGDAFILDNSDMTLKEEVVWTEGLIHGRFGILD